MKIYIGPYTKWIGPYQIADILCFWARPVKENGVFSSKPDWVHNFGTWLAKDKNGNDTWLTMICEKIEERKKRKVKIRIDKYDTWNLNSTLAMIVVPMLKQLKTATPGAPYVDDSDVPKGLRSTSAPPKEDDCNIDGFHFMRWEWVMEEMIWAFEQHHPDCDWENQYFSGTPDYLFEKLPSGNSEMKKGPNHTFKCDEQGMKKHQDRITNGIRLFGKYYQNLWD